MNHEDVFYILLMDICSSFPFCAILNYQGLSRRSIDILDIWGESLC